MDRPDSAAVPVAPSRPEAAPRAVRTLRVLVVSADALERQELAVELAAADDLETASASGFHTAVPALWESRPDVVVVGVLSASDATRLDELASHAGGATLLLLPSASRVPLPRARRLGPDEALLEALRSFAD